MVQEHRHISAVSHLIDTRGLHSSRLLESLARVSSVCNLGKSTGSKIDLEHRRREQQLAEERTNINVGTEFHILRGLGPVLFVR